MIGRGIKSALSTIRGRLWLAFVSMVLLVALLPSAMFYVYEVNQTRSDMEQDISATLGILADNLQGPVAFVDPQAASSVLLSLMNKKQILMACVHLADGSQLSIYTGAAADPLDLSCPETQQQITEETLKWHEEYAVAARPILIDRDAVGYVRMFVSDEQLRDKTSQFLLILTGVLVATIFCAGGILWLLERSIVKPITHLTDTTRQITAQQDYGVRVEAGAYQEIASLANQFNKMMSEVQNRDQFLLDQQQHLESEVRKRTKELDDALQKALAANRSKSEFLANMSHELRTPLNAIIGFSEMILSKMFGDVGSPKYSEYAGLINESGQHLLNIINDILDLAKVEAGKIQLEEEECDFTELAKGSVAMMRIPSETKNVPIRLEAPDNLPRLKVDPRIVKQILLNMLSNAVKFTPAGGRVQVRLGCSDDRELWLEVEDTGCGMSVDEISQAFEPFGQVQQAFVRDHEGCGLGIPLIDRLVKLHQGRFELTSEVNIGTRAKIIFPATRACSGGARGTPGANLIGA